MAGMRTITSSVVLSLLILFVGARVFARLESPVLKEL
jgi:hypothetical protein